MKNPYMAARKRPSAGLPEPFMKNETVIGTIGKTQGVSSAANPQRIASMMSDQSVPPPAASGAVAGVVAASAAEGPFPVAPASVSDGRDAGTVPSPAAEPSGTAIVSSVSSGGMQLVSSQIIHSICALSAACGAASFTRWAKRAFPEKVPISMPNSSSK